MAVRFIIVEFPGWTLEAEEAGEVIRLAALDGFIQLNNVFAITASIRFRPVVSGSRNFLHALNAVQFTDADPLQEFHLRQAGASPVSAVLLHSRSNGEFFRWIFPL